MTNEVTERTDEEIEWQTWVDVLHREFPQDRPDLFAFAVSENLGPLCNGGIVPSDDDDRDVDVSLVVPDSLRFVQIGPDGELHWFVSVYGIDFICRRTHDDKTTWTERRSLARRLSELPPTEQKLPHA